MHNVIIILAIGGAMYVAYKNGYLRFLNIQKPKQDAYTPLIKNSPVPADNPPMQVDTTASGLPAGGTLLRTVLLPFMAKAEAGNGLPSGLLDKIANTESAYRADVVSGKTVSSKGAVGLMQIVPSAHPGAKPLDPIAAINYAANYLRQLYAQFGDWTKAVAAYNWGPGNLSKYGLSKAPAETRNYVKKILGVTV